MGIRTALEMIMRDKVGECKTFTHSIDKFQAAGYFSVRDRNVLEAIIEAGHASAHRGWNPTIGGMDTLLDITESVVQTVYFHATRASELEKNFLPESDVSLLHPTRPIRNWPRRAQSRSHEPSRLQNFGFGVHGRTGGISACSRYETSPAEGERNGTANAKIPTSTDSSSM
jgi:Domain of unknown function (DUF4145)